MNLGGSLVTTRHILTAARCEDQAVYVAFINLYFEKFIIWFEIFFITCSNTARLGAIRIKKPDNKSMKDVEIDHFVSHPEYDSELQLNDIAIVVNFTKFF